LNMVDTIAIVDLGFENLHFLAGDLRAFNATKEFFSFAAEHTSADDFNAAVLSALDHDPLGISEDGGKV
jgi:hypothetical protein